MRESFVGPISLHYVELSNTKGSRINSVSEQWLYVLRI